MQALQNVEPTAAAIALKRIGGVGDQLQLAQHKLRRDDDAVEEAGLGNIGNSAVDDNAGVEDLIAFLTLLLAAEDAAQSCQVQQIALVGPDNQANVRHQKHHQNLQETLRVALRNAAADDQSEKVRAADAEDTANGRPDQPFQADGAQLPFEKDDSGAQQCADSRICIAGQSERFNDEAGYGNNDNKKKTHKNDIHGTPPRECLPICPYHQAMHPCRLRTPRVGIGPSLSHAGR